ncbi:MAG TPA: FAD-dependent oxidoreductase [Verrucomicrobiae bacterium]|nr:FAD-dependent oxidoreductase [Verrucomicrobiae bacterium]
MSAPFSITIDGRPVEVLPGESVLAAARKLAIDIPTLCYLEKCGPLNTCQVCLVKLNGKLVPSCGTKVAPGMAIESETEEVHEARRTALELLFSDHVGDCLSPCHRLCPLGLNIPVMLRHIQAERLDEAAVIVRQAMPLAGILGRLCHHPCEQGCRRGNWDDPAAIRDMERVVADHDSASDAPYTPICEATSGKSVVIVGAGPTGLTAAFYLARNGHHVTVCDRAAAAGGSLREVPDQQLPESVPAAEIAALTRMGIEFKPGVELGRDITAEGLKRGFDAILLAVGELTADEATRLGVPTAGKLVKTDPTTCKTHLDKVFAAGSCVRPQKQLVKAMAEGRAAAECVHRCLSGLPVRRPEKPFSSMMGKLDPGELKSFLAAARHSGPAVSPCDRCAGHTKAEAALESSRCLHCDCASSGNCVLQHYAQVYNADANRFRTERRTYEQQVQPGGIVFEPGKCILCGICVKLTEMAAEPLGLTFIGRGFDVRVSAPFNHAIDAGLQKVAAECVEQCPTGALTFQSEANSAPVEATARSAPAH